jgi:hypothetical protein
VPDGTLSFGRALKTAFREAPLSKLSRRLS